MAAGKLYFYGTCLACLGTDLTWYKRKSPYCSGGKTYHEVSDKMIKEYVLEEMDENDKKELFNKLKEEFGKEE